MPHLLDENIKQASYVGIPTMDPTEWHQVGDSRYHVSRSGQVMGARGAIMRPSVSGNGYLYVSLKYRAKRQKHAYVHRLVAEAFVPNPSKLSVVDHINRVREDNRADNLRWVTHSQNAENRTKGAIKSQTAYHGRPIDQYSRDGVFIRRWPSLVDATKECKIYEQGIWKCCSGRNKTAGGWIWKYAIELEELGENWRSVGDIEVSDFGRVRWPGGITRGTPSGAYLSFRQKFVHRLVAEAFCPKGDKESYVVHIDGNPVNNSAANLKWVTRPQSQVRTMGANAERRGNRAVKSVSVSGETRLYRSVSDAAAAVGVTPGAIGSACRGRTPTIKGMRWEYYGGPIASPPTGLLREVSVAEPTAHSALVTISDDDPLWGVLGLDDVRISDDDPLWKELEL